MNQRKYIDRDVRENPNWVQLVEEYLRNYQGEFDYLVDMKMRLASHYDLTVPMVRGVLNCMRHDPRVKDLPELPAHYEGEAEVIEMPRHSYFRHKQEPIEIIVPERPYYIDLLATVHPEYECIMARTSQLVHKVTKAKARWARVSEGRKFELAVSTNCKYPYSVTNPFIFTEAQYVKYNDDLDMLYDDAEQWKADEVRLIKCTRCW